MKRFSRIFFYLRDQKGKIVGYVVFNLLSILFSLISLAMLAPFLKLLFSEDDAPLTVRPIWKFTSDGLMDQLKWGLTYLKTTYGPANALLTVCAAILISILFKNLFLYFSYRMLIPMRNRIMTNFREDLYNKILILPVSYFTEQRKGDMMSRMSNDMNEIEWCVIGTLEGLIKDPLNILIVLASLIFLSPLLSLVMLVLLPIAGFILGKVSKSLKRQSGDAQEQQGLLLSILDETLGGLRVVKAFNAEKLMRSRFFGSNNILNKLRIQMAFRRDLASPMSEFLGVVIFCFILVIGGYMVFEKKGLAPEAFITYLTLFYQIIQPAKSLSQAFYNMRRGAAAIERIEEVLTAPLAVKEAENPKHLTSFNQSIEFKNVTFKYDDVTILDNINFTVKKGTTVALVGSSGAGKSTLADLIPRFHDASGGEVLVDGVSIKEYSLESLREQMGIVTQEPILFNDTVGANIALSKPNASLEEIQQAAKVANAHEFVMKKEEQYESNIGDRGSKLSGGERQRVTIARAVLKNPPILILDEATSSLDTESERLVQDAINKMMANRTSIVIAHRLSTIRHADEIIVLQKGKIVERGTHDTLIAQNGFYKKLVDMQEVK